MQAKLGERKQAGFDLNKSYGGHLTLFERGERVNQTGIWEEWSKELKQQVQQPPARTCPVCARDKVASVAETA